ncbi:RagB/SusD family nutrient uptake outer membrane protein [Bacteroides caecimuris]|uniref:RagB/SusD family nutrient uptake outer membrane protein n=2 Tax=Bacteroides caecimuris TaxID=1796613 RepID=UPI001C3D4103|nr:RagB/SusD family nutrient uptake outer membrane protein [Bacteroides caecimuris]
MKNFKYYLYTLACAITISSCSLDETSYTEIEKQNYMKNAKEAENVLLGVYRNMVKDGIYGFHLSMYFTIPSDIAKVQGNSTDGLRLIPSNAYTSSQTEIATTWANLYSAIYDANNFIETLQQRIGDYDEKNYKPAAIYMAEARCLRALYYFELVRWFGNVALITNTAQSHQHPSTFTQADPVDVYKFIETDLKYAIENLPYAIDDNIRTNNSFRFSKGAALGLLSKVYATWAGYPIHDTSKWEDAAKTAKILVESGKHHLLNDYDQLWKNTCNGIWDDAESLIEVSFYAPTVTGVAANDPCGRIGKWNGVQASGIRSVRNAGNWRVIPTFLRDWKDRQSDRRWGLSFADYKYGKATDTGENGVKIVINSSGNIEDAILDDAKDGLKKSYIDNVCPRKWDTEDYVSSANYLIDANLSNINWYILRYADVLLLYAEALNEWKQGPTDEAYRAINMVRRRGFGLPVETDNKNSDLSTGMSYEDFQSAVRNERAYELAFEGHRRQDLVRWGIYYESIKQTAQDLVDWYSGGDGFYVCVDYTKKNKNELLPIPQQEMDICKQFEQNQGWK